MKRIKTAHIELAGLAILLLGGDRRRRLLIAARGLAVGESEGRVEEKNGIHARLPKGVRHSRGDGRLEGDLGNFRNAELRLGRKVQCHRGLS